MMKLAQDLTGADFEAMGFETTDCSRFREEACTRCTKGDVVVFLKGAGGIDIELRNPTWAVYFTGQTPISIVMAALAAFPWG